MIKAIQTRYKGYNFRSRLEARWAVFFDALGIQWEYEPEGFELPDGSRYLPDFWLPGVRVRGSDPGLWVEVKGEEPSPSEYEKCGLLSKHAGKTVAMLIGPVGSGIESEFKEVGYGEPSCGWGGNYYIDFPMLWVCCEGCNRVRFEFSEGSYMGCEDCDKDCSYDHPLIVGAIRAARSARFEFGQSGATA